MPGAGKSSRPPWRTRSELSTPMWQLPSGILSANHAKRISHSRVAVPLDPVISPMDHRVVVAPSLRETVRIGRARRQAPRVVRIGIRHRPVARPISGPPEMPFASCCDLEWVQNTRRCSILRRVVLPNFKKFVYERRARFVRLDDRMDALRVHGKQLRITNANQSADGMPHDATNRPRHDWNTNGYY